MKKNQKIGKEKRDLRVTRRLDESRTRGIQGGAAGGVDNDSPYNMPKLFAL